MEEKESGIWGKRASSSKFKIRGRTLPNEGGGANHPTKTRRSKR